MRFILKNKNGLIVQTRLINVDEVLHVSVSHGMIKDFDPFPLWESTEVCFEMKDGQVFTVKGSLGEEALRLFSECSLGADKPTVFVDESQYLEDSEAWAEW